MTASAVRRAIEGWTLPALLRRNAEQFGDQPALTAPTPSGRRTWTWRDLVDEAVAIAHGLCAAGLCRGDRVLIAVSNRQEQWAVDFAALLAGAIPGSVDPTLSDDQLSRLARQSGATVVIVDNSAQACRWRTELVPPRTVVVLDPEPADPRWHRYLDLVARGRERHRRHPDLVGEWVEQVHPGDPVVTIYPSGAAVNPTVVVLSHHNVLYQCAALELIQPAPRHPRLVSYLPLAHIGARINALYALTYTAGHVTVCPDPAMVLPSLTEVNPHRFFGMPRIWEKLATSMRTALSTLDNRHHAEVTQARALASTAYRLRSTGDPVPAELADALAQADRCVLRPLRARWGMAETVWPASGAVPIQPEILEFLGSLGVTIMEVWGLPETTGAVTMNRPHRYRAGTVGHPLPGMEIRLTEDGEILVRGPLVCLGYLQPGGDIDPATDSQGWLATSHIGAFDHNGALRITGHTSDLIITSTGWTIAPDRVESLLTAHPLISHAAVIGDRRPYLVALLVLTEHVDLATRPEVQAELTAAVQQANAALSRSEQIKAFQVLGRPWNPETGELTPALRPQRRVIEERYADLINELYLRPIQVDDRATAVTRQLTHEFTVGG